MSELTRLLQRLHDGEVTVEDAAATIAWLVSTIPDGEKSTDERLCTFEIIQLKMEGVLGDPADSFSQVEVAHLLGELTDEQYDVIRTAVVQGALR